ncbi:HtaA domain-containing protein [Corynebacterium belfantii]|uniref:HtaA domain-containing protein n=1 Tax=Corynebacterium belfantii TaxID=2014537 RepID=UPI002E187FBA
MKLLLDQSLTHKTPDTLEPASASQCEVVQVIESGTLKWGVKQSYRQYIPNKKLANGNWKVAGDIKEVGGKRGKTSTLRFLLIRRYRTLR